MSVSVAFSPQRLDFGGVAAGSGGPDISVDPNVATVFPEAMSFSGGIQIARAPANAGVTATIAGVDSIFTVRDLTVLDFVLREVDPIELPHGFSGPLPKHRVLVPVDATDGVTPLPVRRGQFVVARVAYAAPAGGGVFNGSLILQGDTWERVEVPLSLFTSDVSTKVLTAPVLLPQGQQTELTIEISVASGPDAPVSYGMSRTQLHTGVTMPAQSPLMATQAPQRRTLRLQTAIDAPLGDNVLAIDQFALRRSSFLLPVTVTEDPEPDVARLAIAKKAAERADVLGDAISVVLPVAVGDTPLVDCFVQHFEHGDVYFSPALGAHEVHGDIKIKYDAHGGPTGILGFPESDVRSSRDGRGLFCDFLDASIYWHPDIGPRIVSGATRGAWRAQDAEIGPLGYPVRDHHLLRNTMHLDFPNPNGASWSTFENGAIVDSDEGPFNALVVPEPGREQEALDGLKRLVRQKFDERIHESPNDAGLHPEVEILTSLPVDFDLEQSTGRATTFRLHGFHDSGPAPDAEFTIDIAIRIGWKVEPLLTRTRALTASFVPDSLFVEAHGLGADEIRSTVITEVLAAFAQPVTLAEIPVVVTKKLDPSDPHSKTIDVWAVVDVIVGHDGGLRLLILPEQKPVPIFPLGSSIGFLARNRAEEAFFNFLAGLPFDLTDEV
jgi:hypothetical protein